MSPPTEHSSSGSDTTVSHVLAAMCDAVLMRRPNEKRAKREKDVTFCFSHAIRTAEAAAAEDPQSPAAEQHQQCMASSGSTGSGEDNGAFHANGGADNGSRSSHSSSTGAVAKREARESSDDADAGDNDDGDRDGGESDNEDEVAACVGESQLGVLSGALITMIDSFPDHVTKDMVRVFAWGLSGRARKSARARACVCECVLLGEGNSAAHHESIF